MAAFATLTLTNNAAANVVFAPSKIDANGVATYYSTASVIDARPSASLAVRVPSKTSNVARVTGKIVVPVMDVVNTSLKIAECIGSFELVLPKVATETQRLDARKLLDTLLQNAISTSAVQYLESVY